MRQVSTMHALCGSCLHKAAAAGARGKKRELKGGGIGSYTHLEGDNFLWRARALEGSREFLICILAAC